MDIEDGTPKLWRELWQNITSFSSDGCSSVPDFTFHHCCLQHDYYYRTHEHRHDGTPISRAEADRRLRQCIARSRAGPWHYRFLPWVYWLGVRVAGRRAWRHGK